MPPLVKPEEFVFNSFQVVLFGPTGPVSSGKFLGELLSEFGERFNATPMVLPLPEQAPAELPRVTLQSSDLQWGLEVALSRIVLRWIQMREESKLSPESFKTEFNGFLEKIAKIHPLRIGRLAFLVNRYALTEQSGALICSTFLKELVAAKVLSDLENFEVHFHEKVGIVGSGANEWTRFKSGTLAFPNSTPRPILLVEQDINTLAEEASGKQFSPDGVKGFVDAAISQTQNRFTKLWEA